MKKIKVLTFSGYYLPGYKGGGPVRTIENMIEHLDEELEFWIVTRDRDLGDSTAYPTIERGVWKQIGTAYIYYLPAETTNYEAIRDVIKNTPHDIIYLNSFFDAAFSIYPLVSQYMSSSTLAPVVLAPRGEFSGGALKIKKLKKMIYLQLCRFLGLTKGVTFQASSQYEFNDIKRTLRVKDSSIKIASDLPAKPNRALSKIPPVTPFLESRPLRVIFLSRISPMKNLDFAIKVLMLIQCDLQFDIYGPKEDLTYWEKCEKLLKKLPNNIKFNYCGNVLPKDVKNTFSRYDLFLFPTRGENYGHVIAESISAGTPVLLSDKTPWNTLEADGCGWNVSLEAPEQYANKIHAISGRPYEQRQKDRDHIMRFSEQKLCDPVSVDLNRELFLSLFETRKR